MVRKGRPRGIHQAVRLHGHSQIRRQRTGRQRPRLRRQSVLTLCQHGDAASPSGSMASLFKLPPSTTANASTVRTISSTIRTATSTSPIRRTACRKAWTTRPRNPLSGRLSPQAGRHDYVVDQEMSRPNGIGLSPDSKTLYVANSDNEAAPIIKAFPVKEDGTLGEGRLFF